MDVLQNLVQSRKILRQKVEAAKRGEIDITEKVAKTLKPVTGPLLELVENSKKSTASSPSLLTSTVTKPSAIKTKKKATSSFTFSPIPSQFSSTPKVSNLSRKKPPRVIPFSSPRADTEETTSDDESTVQEEKEDDGESDNDDEEDDEEFYNATSEAASELPKTSRTEERRHGRLASIYLSAYRDQPTMTDQRTGLRPKNGEWWMGSKKAQIKDDKVMIEGATYGGTRGVFELITRRLPDKKIYTSADLETYRAILMQTSAHHKNFDPTEQILGSRAPKHVTIIAPMFRKKKGGGMYKKLAENVDYLYYDNPNLLVRRLKLLIAARAAGNDGVDNEIMEIKNELREKYF